MFVLQQVCLDEELALETKKLSSFIYYLVILACFVFAFVVIYLNLRILIIV